MSPEDINEKQAEECLRLVAPDTEHQISKKDLKNRASRLNNTVLNKIAGLLSFNKEKWEYYAEFCRRNGYDAKPIRSVKEIYTIESSLNARLEKLPKVAIDRLDLTIEFNDKIIKKLNQLKALYLKRKIHYDSKPALKKTTEFHLYKEIYGLIEGVTSSFVQLSDLIRMFMVFEQLTEHFTELSYSKIEIDGFLAEVTDVVVPVFEVEVEKITVEKCGLISQMNNRFIIRLAYYYSSQLFKSYKELIEYLEVRNSVVFYKKVISKYPGKTIKQIYENTAITALKEDFIKHKLEFFYTHIDFILQKIAKINSMDGTLHTLQTNFADRSNAFMTDKDLVNELRGLHQKQKSVYDNFNLDYGNINNSNKIAERSLQELFDDIMKAYAILTSRDIKPSSKFELVRNYLKSVKQTAPKYERINTHDMAVIKNVMNERNVRLLKIYYLALIKLARGESGENAIIEPIIDILREKKPEAEIKSPSGIAYLQLSRVITPEDIINIINVLKHLPKDRSRLNTPLGTFFISLANLYYKNLKKEIDYPPEIRPIGNKEDYISALIEQKLIKLYFAAMNQPVDDGSLLDFFADEIEKEKIALERIQKEVEIKVFYLINSMIAYWNRETNTAIRKLLTAPAEEKKYDINSKFHKLTVLNIKQMIEHFTEDHLKTLNRHCDALNSIYEKVFKNGIYPSFKEELLLLHIAHEKLYTLREDDREKHTYLLERIELFKRDIKDEVEKLPST